MLELFMQIPHEYSVPIVCGVCYIWRRILTEIKWAFSFVLLKVLLLIIIEGNISMILGWASYQASMSFSGVPENTGLPIAISAFITLLGMDKSTKYFDVFVSKLGSK